MIVVQNWHSWLLLEANHVPGAQCVYFEHRKLCASNNFREPMLYTTSEENTSPLAIVPLGSPVPLYGNRVCTLDLKYNNELRHVHV
jgi:hypothetical protein